MIRKLGVAGIRMRERLERWELLRWTSKNDLATAYYHATLLFLVRNYTYYPYWQDCPHPSLGHHEMQRHVANVVSMGESIVSSENIPGVLLLFPLRVAGSLAGDLEMRRRITACLDKVYWKGFVVTQQVKIDLQDLWAYQGLEYIG